MVSTKQPVALADIQQAIVHTQQDTVFWYLEWSANKETLLCCLAAALIIAALTAFWDARVQRRLRGQSLQLFMLVGLLLSVLFIGGLGSLFSKIPSELANDTLVLAKADAILGGHEEVQPPERISDLLRLRMKIEGELAEAYAIQRKLNLLSLGSSQ